MFRYFRTGFHPNRLAMSIPVSILILTSFAASLFNSAPIEIDKGGRFYTSSKIVAARTNIAKYDWAKELRSQAVSDADRYLKAGYEKLWNAVTPQSIPRGYAVNQDAGSPVTGKALDRFGAYPYKFDPLGDPWKLTDPSSGYKFPTNDFAAYYKSGLDKNGKFRKELADKKYLKNVLYPEKGETWGVDDGSGWSDGSGRRFTFVAYYNHWAVWDGLMQDALSSLRDAYLYTGRDEYAQAGVVLLDRIADIYPELDLSVYTWDKGFRNSTGGTGQGKSIGSIWEGRLVKTMLSANDAFMPVLESNPEQVIAFLGKKADTYSLGSDKKSAAGIKKHIAEGIVGQVFPAVLQAKIAGNTGFYQSTLAMAAVVSENPVLSAVWNDFLFKSGSLQQKGNSYSITGGDLLSLLVNEVDRNGFGAEVSPDYNYFWLSALYETAVILNEYRGVGKAGLFENIKFRKMLTSFADLIMAGQFLPHIGDSGTTGGKGLPFDVKLFADAYVHWKDPKLAQLVYFLNGNTVKGLHGDVFSPDPQDTSKLIEKEIAAKGPLQLASNNLTGYGLSILRDGKTQPAAAAANGDNQRDVWSYYGQTQGSHAHRDVLNIGLYAFGTDLAPDLGYVSFADANDLRSYWEAGTVSHNTVVVDGARQEKASPGIPVHFDETDRVKLMENEAPSVYPGTQMYRRTTAMIKIDGDSSYAVDWFRVKGGNEHVFSFHGASDDVTWEGLNPQPQGKGTYAGPGVPYADVSYNKKTGSGFNYLQNVSRDSKPADSFSVDWKAGVGGSAKTEGEPVHLRLTMLGQANEAALAAGIPPQNKLGNPEQLRYLLVKRSGEGLQSVFTSVLEPYQGNRAIRSIESVKVTSGGNAVDPYEARAVKVVLADRTDYVVSSLDPGKTYVLDGRIRFQGAFGVFSEKSGKPEFGYVHDGTLLQAGDKTLIQQKAARVTGKVGDFTRELADRNFISVSPDAGAGALPDPSGKYIFIDNGYPLNQKKEGTRSAVYRISGTVGGSQGQTVKLDIGDTPLIGKWRDPSDFRKGYDYDIESGAKFSIPLTHTWQFGG